jgi:hypothetical protein
MELRYADDGPGDAAAPHDRLDPELRGVVRKRDRIAADDRDEHEVAHASGLGCGEQPARREHVRVPHALGAREVKGDVDVPERRLERAVQQVRTAPVAARLRLRWALPPAEDAQAGRSSLIEQADDVASQRAGRASDEDAKGRRRHHRTERCRLTTSPTTSAAG